MIYKVVEAVFRKSKGYSLYRQCLGYRIRPESQFSPVRTIESILTTYISEMDQGNITVVTEFILMGLTYLPEFQLLLFLMIRAIYLMSLLGNLGLIVLITIYSRLHTPMYFFLGNLSALDFSYSSAIAPKMLADFFLEVRTISLIECAIQMYLLLACITTEGYLLAVMAYDRFMAICNPLLYVVVMSPRVCTQLMLGSYLIGLLQGLIQVLLILRLPFCKPNIINHFFCDLPPVFKVSCSNTFPNEVLLFSLGFFNGTVTFLEIVVSYVYILITILKIRSAAGRRKAFCTCVSHITVVGLLYGTAIFVYIRPSSHYAPENDKVVSVFYTLVIPMLNPLIYSLRNKDVKDALWKITHGKA
ncbi:olfactory receptor 1019-like [Tachyglossus aculeatus]|uniref:olfactory receptor 1019-like n=1 Tax=Tachyglossus aculeatus TaxID=9261 RepID=UPI0018F7ADD0|nr:olfactory receptor 1019-like [Tachyglossus aculeatus]